MKVALQIRDSAREPVVTELEVVEIPSGKRIGQAVLKLVVLWVLAVCCILVPLLHFVLVPGLLLAGPVVAWLSFKDTVLVKTPRLACPKCGKETELEPGTKGWPAPMRCAHCSTTFSAKPL